MADAVRRWSRELRRAISWHRRLLAAGLAAGSVGLTINALQPPPTPTVAVLAAADDLPGGRPLRGGDLATVRLPPNLVPAGALRRRAEVEGRTLASPVRRGEPLTDARIVGPGLVSRQQDAGAGVVVAAPVRLADADAALLLRVGDRVDVLAADPGPEDGRVGQDPARTVAVSALVLAVPRPADGHGLSAPQVSEGALVVLATSREVAAVLARAAVTSRLSVAIRDG